MTALLAVLHSSPSGKSPSGWDAGAQLPRLPQQPWGFLVLLISCTKSSDGICTLPQVFLPPPLPNLTKVTPPMLSLLKGYKFIIKPFAGLGQSLLLH